MNDDDDLYGDLKDVKLKPKSSIPTVQLEEKVGELKGIIVSLKKENETLKRNMGILFRTARSEIARKDNQIELLNQQLDELSQKT